MRGSVRVCMCEQCGCHESTRQHSRTHTSIPQRTHTHTQTDERTHTHTHTHTHTRKLTHAQTPTHARSLSTNTHTRTHTHTHHTRSHTQQSLCAVGCSIDSKYLGTEKFIMDESVRSGTRTLRVFVCSYRVSICVRRAGYVGLHLHPHSPITRSHSCRTPTHRTKPHTNTHSSTVVSGCKFVRFQRFGQTSKQFLHLSNAQTKDPGGLETQTHQPTYHTQSHAHTHTYTHTHTHTHTHRHTGTHAHTTPTTQHPQHATPAFSHSSPLSHSHSLARARCSEGGRVCAR